MKRCLLHVGMHKTGTTSVQHNLRRIGNTSDWRYLCVGSKLHMNIPFFAMFATDPFSYIWFSRLGITKEEAAERGRFLREKLADAIREAPEETIIMSAEALTLVDPDGIQRLKDFLAPFFDEIISTSSSCPVEPRKSPAPSRSARGVATASALHTDRARCAAPSASLPG